MNVLSLFDGLGGARISLHHLGITCHNYFASEVDRFAIQVAKANYPDIIHKGSVQHVLESNFIKSIKIDLLIGGSPCQDLTSSGTRKGIEGERSALFFYYHRIREILKPKYFILENVASMRKADRDIITEYMGVEPVMIDSANFGPQRRRRLYWTNIDIPPIPHSNETIGNILQVQPQIKPLTQTHLNAFHKSYKWKPTNFDMKSPPLMATYYKQPPHQPYVPCAECESGYRLLTPIECERLQGIPDNYTEMVSWTQRMKMIGNGFTIPVIMHILSGMNIWKFSEEKNNYSNSIVF